MSVGLGGRAGHRGPESLLQQTRPHFVPLYLLLDHTHDHWYLIPTSKTNEIN